MKIDSIVRDISSLVRSRWIGLLVCAVALCGFASCAGDDPLLEEDIVPPVLQPEPAPDPDPEEPRGPVRILAIGNSFSQDAVEQYLYELAHAAGHDVVIGNMYIGGCDLDTHLANMRDNKAAYEYRKIVDGSKTSRSSFSLAAALADEEWDYISLQQASGKSGRYETYTALPELITLVKAQCPEAVMMWHQTWAYASSSTHESFPAYGRDQAVMYRAIVSAARSAVTDNPELQLMIPAGSAVQNGRATFLGDTFSRDGYHMETTYGRYTVACTWFETVFGDDVTANTYAPESVDQQVAQLARAAAHRAVALPDDVADMSDFEKPHTTPGALSQPLYVDFGSGLSAMPWNNVTTHDNSGTKFWLKTPEGVYTDVAIEVSGGFTGVYPGVGGETSHKAFTVSGTEFPVSAWKDALIVSGTKGGGDVGPGVLTVSGLDPSAEYDFTILAVRYNGSRSARVSTYRIVGRSDSETKEIYTGLKIGSSGNEVFPSFDVVPFGEFVVEFAAIAPDGNGTVAVEVRGVDTGVAADGHISALVIRERR